MGRRTHVVVRLRPSGGDRRCVDISDVDGAEVVVSDTAGLSSISIPHRFCVDRVLDEGCTNNELFKKLVYDRILSSAEQPDTSCFLAYGHTNSGKTHTIAGGRREMGLLSLAARAVLDMYGYLEVAMIEVYGENVHDLLARGERRLIRRRVGPEGVAIVVEDLTICSLSTLQEWEAVSAFGMETRRTAPTERNSRSSRSHALFTIKSRGLRLCMVDLAGSERQTTYSPQLNAESIAINKSLSRLSTVLEALSTVRRRPDGTSPYVNFRDTTLTVLLQRYLCGASMTVFVACIHPDVQFMQETMSTMRYTQRLKRIKTRAPPQKPADDSSLFHPKEQKNLLEELLALRRIVAAKPYAGVDAREDGSVSQKMDHCGCAPAPFPNDTGVEAAGPVRGERSLLRSRQRLLRSKDIRRVAGWLVSRTLGMLPQLSVGFDDYFDEYLPKEVHVVGYVSLMACLPPCTKDEALNGLAFLDVGNPAMGLSMLDAGIPACVGLHRLCCAEVHSWEAHEYNEANNVFLLAFFKVSDELVEPMVDSGNPFECCGGLLTLEPLVPLALVFCMLRDASDEVKENVLQHLVTLQSEQHCSAGASTGTQTSPSRRKESPDFHDQLSIFESESLHSQLDCSHCYEEVEDHMTRSQAASEEEALKGNSSKHDVSELRSHLSGKNGVLEGASTPVSRCRLVLEGLSHANSQSQLSPLLSSSSSVEEVPDPSLVQEAVADPQTKDVIDDGKNDPTPPSGEQIITDSTNQCEAGALTDQRHPHTWGDSSGLSLGDVELTMSNMSGVPPSAVSMGPQQKGLRTILSCDEQSCLSSSLTEVPPCVNSYSGGFVREGTTKGKKVKRINRENHRSREPVSHGCHHCVLM